VTGHVRWLGERWHLGLFAAAVALVVVLAGVLFAVGHDDRSLRPVDLGAGPHASPVVGVQFHGTWTDLSDSDRERILDALVANGVTWVRVDVSWSMLEPRRGEHDDKWAGPLVDRVLTMAHERGLKVLGMFWLTPGWANGGAGRRVLPDDPADYARALAWAAERWRDQVQAWEVWNEPNSEEFLAPPDPAGYVRLLKAAYPAVKAANPDARVVFGGTQYVDTDWIAKAYEYGAEGSFDVMAVHPYQGLASLPPEAGTDGGPQRLTATGRLVALMRAEGQLDVPIWFTEFGWSVHENQPDTPAWNRGVTERAQADYLRRTLSLVRGKFPEVTNVFWYTSRDLTTGKVHQDHRGLLRRDFSPRPALGALRCYVRGCQPRAAAR
jgi:hypothetical protein